MLAASSMAVGAHDLEMSEARLAQELIWGIALDSRCPAFAVAWFDHARLQLETQCAASLAESRAIVEGAPPKVPRVIVDVDAALAQAPAGRLRISSEVLARKLSAASSRSLAESWPTGRSPLIVYRRHCCQSSSESGFATQGSDWIKIPKQSEGGQHPSGITNSAIAPQ
jgi:hypothetical protein